MCGGGTRRLTITHVIGYRVIGLHFHPFVCEKEKREAELSQGLQSVSMNGLSRGKLSLIVKSFGRSLFYATSC